jgi:uncharacterized protein DUF4180
MSALQTAPIRSAADISPALGMSLRHGGLIVMEADLCADFFNLRTGFAGELLQKFVNYRAKLAIVIADPKAHGERFGELVYEHQAHPHVRFFTSEADARGWLDEQGSHAQA